MRENKNEQSPPSTILTVNGIGYDYDLGDNIVGTGLVDMTPNGKQFCLLL